MLIRHAKMDDWTDICQIEEACFRKEEAATPEDLKKRLLHLSSTFLVAIIDDRVAGFIVGQVSDQRYLSDDFFHTTHQNAEKGGFVILTSLAISPHFRGQGIGTALLAAMKDLSVAQGRSGISLTCHDYLISYYEMNGFTDEGESASTHGGGTWYNLVWEVPD